MACKEFEILLAALAVSDLLSDRELRLVTSGYWGFDNVPAIDCEEQASVYFQAAKSLQIRAAVERGSPDWLLWLSEPEGKLHSFLVARLTDWRPVSTSTGTARRM